MTTAINFEKVIRAQLFESCPNNALVLLKDIKVFGKTIFKSRWMDTNTFKFYKVLPDDSFISVKGGVCYKAKILLELSDGCTHTLQFYSDEFAREYFDKLCERVRLSKME